LRISGTGKQVVGESKDATVACLEYAYFLFDDITLEAAKSGRSTCRICAQKIQAGMQRVGVKVFKGGRYVVQWRHPSCFLHQCQVNKADSNRGKCRVSQTPFEKGALRFGWGNGQGGFSYTLVKHVGATAIPRILLQEALSPDDLQGVALLTASDKDKLHAALAQTADSLIDANIRAADAAAASAGAEAGASVLASNNGVGVWRQLDGDFESREFGLSGDADVLYVGKAKNLRKRVLSYVGGGGGGKQSARIGAMIARAETVDYIITPDGEHDALLLEARLIKKLQPPYNVLLRDDKFYPYVCVSLGDALPRVFSVPRKLAPSGDTAKYRYFGPYTDGAQLRRTLALLEQAFRLRRLRFEARYGDRNQANASDVTGAELGERENAAQAQYQTAVSRCIRVLEGHVGEVIAEMEAGGLGSHALPLRSLASPAATPYGGAGDQDTEDGRGAGRGLVDNFQLRGELDFLGWDSASEAPALDVVAFASIPLPMSGARDSAGERVDEEKGRGGEVGGREVEGVVQILCVREGCVTGRFTYRVSVPLIQDAGGEVGILASDVSGIGSRGGGQQEVMADEEEYDAGEAILGVLQNHYLAAAPADIPQVVLTQVRLETVEEDANAALKNLLQRRLLLDATDQSRPHTVEVRSTAVKTRKSSRKKPAQGKDASKKVRRTLEAAVKQLSANRDRRAMQLAVANAQAQAQRIADSRQGWLRAAKDLQTLLALPQHVLPRRIEWYSFSNPLCAQFSSSSCHT